MGGGAGPEPDGPKPPNFFDGGLGGLEKKSKLLNCNVKIKIHFASIVWTTYCTYTLGRQTNQMIVKQSMK